MGKKSSGGFYAVGKGRNTGIFNTWTECEANIKGFPDAKFKKFSTESEAQNFVDQWATNVHSSGHSKNTQIINDATAKGIITPQSSYLPSSSFSTHAPSSTDDDSVHEKKDNPQDKLQRTIGSSKRMAAKRTIQLLDSPVAKYHTKKLCMDSPKTKGKESFDGEKVYLPFIVDADNFVNVYTDGACLQNGRSCPKAGVGVWFGDDHPLNKSQPVDGPATNNTAEIQAARLAIEIAVQAGFQKLRINTDSSFLISCATDWVHKWKQNGWKLSTGGDVKNRVELEKLDEAQQNIVVQWVKVPAHTGVHGNEMADHLANQGALRY